MQALEVDAVEGDNRSPFTRGVSKLRLVILAGLPHIIRIQAVDAGAPEHAEQAAFHRILIAVQRERH